MTDHNPIHAAAIAEAARAAGIYDPADAIAAIPAGETLPPAEAVAALKIIKPHWFRPPDARDMTPKERDAAMQRIGVNPRTIRRY